MRPEGPLSGFIQPPLTAPIIPNAPGGSLVNFDLRVWDNQNNTVTTWAQVMANPNTVRASSGIFTSAVTELPDTPPNLVGLTSFNVFIVPEPRLIPLAFAGAILLALIRWQRE